MQQIPRQPSTPRIRLITRGDDAGSCESADLALLEACDQGILRNVSVMVPGPSLAHAARVFRGRPDLCLGLHVTLNAEWAAWTWGPVLPAAQVPSLVDAGGRFLPTPQAMRERGFDEDQAVAEVEAQLRLAREAGLAIQYLDEHMGVGWLGGLGPRLTQLAQREGLVEAGRFQGLPAAPEPAADWVARLGQRLAQAATGTYVLVNHPGFDRDDMRQFALPGQPCGEVARERDAERRGLTDPRLPGMLQAYGAVPTRYCNR